MTERVAVIGVGAQGGTIARRLIASKLAVTCCDRDRAKLDVLKAAGASVTMTPADCAECQTVLIVVATEDQLRGVILGDDGLLGRAGSAPMRRVAVMSTVAPEAVIEIGDVLRPRGVAVIDSPVSGGPERALQGDLTIIAGGSKEDIAAMSTIYDSIASHVFHCGGLGAGQTAKIVNNLVSHANTLVTAEAFRFAIGLGLDPNVMSDIMEVSTGRNYMTRPPGVQRSLRRHVGDRQTFDRILGILAKDTAIGAELVTDRKADFPVITALANLVGSLGDETFENWEIASGGERANEA